MADRARGGVADVGALMQYVGGCITRERERIARILEDHGAGAEIVAAIMDTSDDARVFMWAGPRSPLGGPRSREPQPLAQPRETIDRRGGGR
jgi:hypothetical protein